MAESSDRTRPQAAAAALYVFRGRAYPLTSLFSPLLEALADAPADPEAAAVVKDVLADEGPAALFAPLLAGLGDLEIDRRPAVLGTLAGVVVGTPLRVELLDRLAARPEPLLRHLALALVARLSLPLTSDQVAALRPLVGDRRVARSVRIAAVAQLCRATLRERDERGVEVMQAFLGSARRSKALRRLTTVRDHVGPHPLLDALIERLERRTRMTCPRCRVKMRRPLMVQHLWDEHRLLLDGRTVREPWTVIEDWLRPYPADVPADVVERCRDLARRMDAEKGPARLEEMLRARQPPPAPPPEWLSDVLDVIPVDASACPRCATMVPATPPVPVPRVGAAPGRLAGGGYEVAVGRRGVRTRLCVVAGPSLLVDGPEPGQWLTPDGAVLAVAGVPVLLALAWAVGLVPGMPLVPVLVLLGVALLTGAGARWGWDRRPALADRAVDYAWTLVVPRLHGLEFSTRDSGFLCGLAAESVGRGQGASRALLLSTMSGRTQQALTTNAGLAGHLAALRRLAIDDAVADGRDPVPLVVEEVGRCFEGKLPLAYAHDLLDGWAARWWTPGRKARLRVLLCDRAFEIGLEVAPLLALAAAAPALGEALEAHEPGRLAHLRLIWSLRPLRPWDRIGPASNVFEWAVLPASEPVLEVCPDLLLIEEEGDYRAAALDGQKEQLRPVRLVVCGRGVILQGVLFPSAPRAVEITRTGVLFRAGHELTLDGRRFQFDRDPEPVVQRLEEWCRYLWNELLPQTGRAANWQSPMVKRLLRPPGAGTCPRCRAPLLLRPGQSAVEVPQIAGSEG